MTLVTAWSDEKFEQPLREDASIDEAWALIERFARLVRESGSEDEWLAARDIVERLERFGVEYRFHEPELFLSIPKRARLVIDVNGERRELRAKTPSFSVSTDDHGIDSELVYVPSSQAKGVSDLFGAQMEIPEGIEGKVVLTEGNPLPGKVASFAEAGITAVVFVGPGEHIHEGIITPIWGAPGLDEVDEQPRIPVIGINRSDGAWLIEQCRSSDISASINTYLDEGWMRCPLVEAFIPGNVEPEKFVLVHGHIDSWHVGIGDNATGDATLLEVARLLHSYQQHLARTVRICWWPGHSTGRYAGSTWYVDQFALDIDANCVAHINCDSPGCRWATTYENVMWMPEAEDVARGAIEAAVGQKATGLRPLRAGDISFNNLGVSTFFMLTSTMSSEELEEKGYHPVGGCGGNIEWHTEDDTIDIADREILLKDIRIYATAALRMANAPVVPLDYRRTVEDLEQHLRGYADAAGERVPFDEVFAAAGRAREALDELYARADEVVSRGAGPGDPEAGSVSEALLRAGRQLVAIGFSQRGRFRQDPALNIAPIPAVAPAAALGKLPEGSHLDRVTRAHIKRGLNQVTWSFRQVEREASLAKR